MLELSYPNRERPEAPQRRYSVDTLGYSENPNTPRLDLIRIGRSLYVGVLGGSIMSTNGETGKPSGSSVEARSAALDSLAVSVLEETESRELGTTVLSILMFVIAALLLGLGLWSLWPAWPASSDAVPGNVMKKIEEFSVFAPAGFVIAGYLCMVYASVASQFSRARETLKQIKSWGQSQSRLTEAKIAAETTAIRRIQSIADSMSKMVVTSLFCALVGVLTGFLAAADNPQFGNGKTAALMALLAGVGLPVGILSFRAFAARQFRRAAPKIREEMSQIEEKQQQLAKEMQDAQAHGENVVLNALRNRIDASSEKLAVLHQRWLEALGLKTEIPGVHDIVVSMLPGDSLSSTTLRSSECDTTGQTPSQNTEEQLRLLAYRLWERAGRPDGLADKFWEMARCYSESNGGAS
jgi:hypothetical protein